MSKGDDGKIVDARVCARDPVGAKKFYAHEALQSAIDDFRRVKIREITCDALNAEDAP